jgi:hypothetical protein
MYKSINRGKLLRAAKAGKLVGKVSNHLTDDYAFDAANNFGRTEWLPVVIDNKAGAWAEGKITLYEDAFRGRGGYAYEADEGNGEIILGIYSGYTLHVKIVETPAASTPAAAAAEKTEEVAAASSDTTQTKAS